MRQVQSTGVRVLQVILIALLSSPGLDAQPRINAVGLQLEQVFTTRGAIQFGIPIDAKVGPEGDLFVADYAMRQVLRIAPNGELLWRVGQDGDGPGEYRLPYRVAPTLDGRILVYDMGRQDITYLSSSGQYLKRTRLPFPIGPVNDVVALPSDRLAIAGVTQWGVGAEGRAVHVFDEGLQHVMSFGLLPALSERKLKVWGAGAIASTDKASIWHSSAEPLKLSRYSFDGVLSREIAIPVEPLGRLEDIVVAGNGQGISIDESRTTRLHRAYELDDGSVLMSRTHGGVKYLDKYTKDGNLITDRLPRTWFTILAYHPATSTLWVAETIDEELVMTAFRLLPASGR